MPFQGVAGPADLKKMSLQDLEFLAQEIRQRILSVCMKNGGHLGASLGAVELAIALHYVFSSPAEPIVWDVGHQAYAHKLLTGRWESFESLRQFGGISGFPSRSESPHDAFGTGHSSTSLSAALAMAWTRKATRQWTVAVIGDGGLTSGLALEALNNFQAKEVGPALIIVNDNQMSISRSVGAVPSGVLGAGAGRFFEDLGFEFKGTIDGHDLKSLIGTLSEIRAHEGGRPLVLHVLTQKGRGYVPAEELPDVFHGIAAISPAQPAGSAGAGRAKRTFSEVFGREICALAQADPKVVAISAAMTEGTGLTEFARRFPERFFDVGIAESHAVTFAAGLAVSGWKPVVAIYSSFMQRALDQIIHDVALQGLGVTFVLDRAGLVGADGATHHGLYDLAYLGMIPGLTVVAPETLSDFPRQLAEAVGSGRPVALRFPRGSAPETFAAMEEEDVYFHVLPKAPRLLAVGVGAATARLLRAAAIADPSKTRIAVISTSKVKPFSPRLQRALDEILGQAGCDHVLCLEDGVLRGGFGQSLLADNPQWGERWINVGFGDVFPPHGSPAELQRLTGVDSEAIALRMTKLLGPEE